jgi:TctA family transporter
MIFLQRPISLTLLILTLATVVVPRLLALLAARRERSIATDAH